MTASPARRYDLDWLRVIAFGVLIFYHIGMFYVTWDWHVKSPHAGPAAELPMVLVNIWRLELLFFISGVALRYASDKAGLGAGAHLGFAGQRFWRLAAPIVFGMAVVVAPQSYFQLLQQGEIAPGFWRFYPDYLSFAQKFSVITPTWNHLWYVVYMLFYSMIALAAAPLLRPLANALSRVRGAGTAILLLAPLPFLAYRYLLEPQFPTTHALVDDWATHAHSFTIFLFGFIVAKNEGFWRAVRRALPVAAPVAAACATIIGFVWLGDRWEAIRSNPVAAALFPALRIVYLWSVILTIAGLGMRFLDRDSKTLRYLTNGVFCYYILHQTIIVAAGYYLARLDLSWQAEFAVLSVLTVAGCGLGYEAVRRIPVLRPFFGVSGKGASRPARTGHAPRAAALCDDTA
ncbi:MAG: acyltransferase family protein [Pseudomonadota bacterium]|nr:acyltransferase family protein [Pseudomonadota bacterium]